MLSLLERALRYQRIHGTRQMARQAWARIKLRLLPAAVPPGIASAAIDDSGWVNARELVAKRSLSCSALRLFTVPAATPPRVTLVTDSISRGSLYGGVGTSIILAALVAQARGARLRIVTRTERAHPSALDSVLSTYAIALEHEVEFAFAPFYDTSYEIDTFPHELYITSSWWTTASTLASVPVDDVAYLLQEDERMFYPYGDEHLRCSQVLAHPGLRFIINTRLLFDHLAASGLSNVQANGIWFEPSFPPAVFHPRDTGVATGKKTLTFYARPHNVRNLFYFGIEVLESAIARGVIDLNVWDVVFMGKDIPRIRLDDGRYTPKRMENMSWTEYAELAGRTDLALCLMYTPHPSYPPFDMAASGAVVVTNRFANKQDLTAYSRNILCGDLEVDAMVSELARGVALALDGETRAANWRANQLGSDWRKSFAGVVERLGRPG